MIFIPPPKKNEKILVAMSSGVDSSISCLLLKKSGWDVIGITFLLPKWKVGNISSDNMDKAILAKKIAKRIAIPHRIIDLKPEFTKEIVAYFIEQYRTGRTPNPCMMCNPKIKFKYLFEEAKKLGIKYVGTGHYARTRKSEITCPPSALAEGKCRRGNPKSEKYQLIKAVDKNKDQTYYLSFLKKEWLPFIVFPMGSLTKKEVFAIAKKEKLEMFDDYKESQDFCFVSGKSFPAFLKEKVGLKKGKIINNQGQVIGKHQGLHFFTIGQRKRLNISKGSKPWFVQNFDIKNNNLIITNDEKDLNQKEVILAPFNFLSIEPPAKPMKVMAKIRYRAELSKATLYPKNYDKIKIIFDKAQRAITPGQYCVFYSKDICLGGGRIN